LSSQNFFWSPEVSGRKKKYLGSSLFHFVRVIRKILFIDTYWIPDKFLLRLLADAKFSGMTITKSVNFKNYDQQTHPRH